MPLFTAVPVQYPERGMTAAAIEQVDLHEIHRLTGHHDNSSFGADLRSLRTDRPSFGTANADSLVAQLVRSPRAIKSTRK